jgi:peptidoglycan/xylan/chitin deacetylase (PgdA/CDA1 family)
MTYNKTTWENRVPPRINATKLNKIEIGIEDAHEMATGRCATLVVAASDSSALSKQQSDYVCDGTDDQVTIQAAIDASSGDIYFSEGNYVKGNVGGITIPSNRCLRLSWGATIKYKTDVGDGAVIFENADAVSGNENISIIGGILDGNSANQASGSQNAISLTDVSNSKIDTLMQDFVGRPMSVSGGHGNYIVNRMYPNAKHVDIDLVGLMAKHPNVEIIDPIDDDATWTPFAGTSWDSTEAYAGDESLKMDIEVGATGRTIYKDFSPSLDISNSSIGAWIKYDSITSGATIVVQYEIYAPDASNRIVARVEYRKVEYVPNKWLYAGIEPNTPYAHNRTGNPDLTDVTRIYIKVYSATSGFNVWVDALTRVKHLFPKGTICLTFDGPYDSQYETAFPIMQKHNVKGVMWAVTGNVDTAGNLTMDQLLELQRAGWDISSHAQEMVNIGTSDLGEAERVIAMSKDWLVSNGFDRGARFFSRPFGGTSIAAEAIVDDYFILSRGITANDHGPGLPLFEPSDVKCLPGKGTLVGAKANVDEIAESGAFGMFYWHNITDPAQSGELTPTELDTLIAYIKTKGVKVITLSDMVDKYLQAPIVQQQVSDMFMDVLAVSATHVRSNEDLSAATPITFTIDAQPDVPRTLSWSFDSHAQITEYDMEVIGVDAKGNTVTETWDETAGWSGETSNAFATITSIKMTSRTGTGVADTMDIGITDVLGLSNIIYATSDVFKIKKNTANATVATSQVNTPYDTYDMSVIGLGAADDFTIWYKSNLNIIS